LQKTLALNSNAEQSPTGAEQSINGITFDRIKTGEEDLMNITSNTSKQEGIIIDRSNIMQHDVSSLKQLGFQQQSPNITSEKINEWHDSARSKNPSLTNSLLASAT
jgi:hypothetical protein